MVAEADKDKASERKTLNTAMMVGRIYFEQHLKDAEAQAYIKARGISSSATVKFKLGYAPEGGRNLVDHISYQNIRVAAREAGLLTFAKDKQQNPTKRFLDVFRGRLMFPIRDDTGALLGFAGRLLEPKEGVPKYVNTTETALFTKGNLLYGLFENGDTIRKVREAILVEGYTDVIALADNDVALAVAPMGTALTENQFKLILNSGVRVLTICTDGDQAGIVAAERQIGVVMKQYHPGLAIRVMALPDGHDPDSFLKASGRDAFLAEKDKATPLEAYIHERCSAGHRSPPGIGDQAEYLTRLKPYAELASGALYTELHRRAVEYTGLPSPQLKELLPNAAQSNSVIEWDSNTTLAARWLVHDLPLQPAIAAKLSNITLKALGLGELADMAKVILAGEKPTGDLHQYAKAHGPLTQAEVKELRANWQSWMKRASISEGLSGLNDNPFSVNAKHTLRMALR